MIPAEKKTKTNFDFENFTQKFTFFVMFYEQKNAFIAPLHHSFLFTNKQEVLSSAQTDQSQSQLSSRFPAQN